MGSMRGGLVLGDKQWRDSGAWVEGRGLRGKARALAHRPSICSMFARRHEVIECD